MANKIDRWNWPWQSPSEEQLEGTSWVLRLPIGTYFGGEAETPPLPTRPPLGAESRRAAQEQAKYFQSILNQQMGQNIGMINRQLGTAGRYSSGLRPRLIGQEMQRTGQQLGQMVSGTEMDRFRAVMSAQLAREQMDEEAAWRQAQLEAGGVAGERQMYGQFGQALFLYLLQNPELLAAL